MKPITRPVHTFKKAVSLLKSALRARKKDGDSPAWNGIIRHNLTTAWKFAKTDSERALLTTLTQHTNAE